MVHGDGCWRSVQPPIRKYVKKACLFFSVKILAHSWKRMATPFLGNIHSFICRAIFLATREGYPTKNEINFWGIFIFALLIKKSFKLWLDILLDSLCPRKYFLLALSNLDRFDKIKKFTYISKWSSLANKNKNCQA